ncbi:GntR family transcriptional regulator [Spiroplasma gladiatoris]|uniref:GntR family transcriptional regulator n=1 Tax=Spiroplasma gladiatoris TaxID=2143 RepID=UPI0010684211
MIKKWEEIYEYLLEIIRLKTFDKNGFLPSENSLKTKFKVLIQSVRKAFYKLIENKLVEAYQGKGYKILQNEYNVLFSFSNLYLDAKSC